MTETRQALQSKLAQARHDLAESQTRVTELEALLTTNQTILDTLLAKEGYEDKQALEEIRSLAKFPGDNPNPLLSVASDGTLLYANPASYRLLALWGCEVGTRLPEDLQQVISESVATDRSREIEVICGEIHYALTFVPLDDGSYTHIYGQDITQRKHAKAHIRKLNRILSVLSDVNQAIVRIRHQPVLFEKACGIAVEKGAFRMAWIGLLEPKTGRVNPVAHAGVTDGYLDNLDIVLSDDPRGQGPTARALRSGAHVICNDIENEPQMLPWRADALRLGYRSSIALPLIVAGEVRGIFNLYANEPNFFDDEELQMLDEMAEDISFAIEFAEREAKHQQSQVAVLDIESRYHRVLDSMLEGAEIIGFDWRYLYVNDASASHGRQSKDVLLRSTVIELYPGIENTEMFGVFRKCMEERTAQHFESEFVFPDGVAAWFELSVQPIPEGIFILSLEITERKRSEAALNRYAQRLEGLHEIDTKIIEATSIQPLLEVIVKHLRTLIPCPRVAAALIDPVTGESVIFAVDLNSPSAVGPGVRTLLPVNWFDGFDADHTRVIDDFRSVSDPLPTYQQLIKEGMVTSLQVLLMDREHTIGLLTLSTDTLGFFTTEHREIAAEIANQLAIAIHQMHLSQELARHAAELEQKVVERTADLSAVKERVEAILNNSTDGILLVHTDLNIRQTNASFNILFACEPDDYFGKPLVSIVHAEDIALVTRTLQAAVVEQQAKSIEIRTLRKDGKDGKDFDAELSIGHIKDDGLVCTIRDITERKTRERQLRYQATLQENVSDAVIVTDMAFRVQSWNPAAERIVGWRAEEVIGKLGSEVLQTQFVSPGGREEFVSQLHNQGWWQGELIVRHKNGSIIHTMGSNTMVKDESGVPFALVAVNRDITEQKAQERQLRYQASLQDNVTDAVIVTDMEFRIQSWNRAAERIYGWSAEEIIGKAHIKILGTEFSSDSERERNTQQLREQGWWQGEVKQHRKDGSIRDMLGSVTLVKEANGVPFGIISVNHDITERKQAEEVINTKLEAEREFQRHLKELHEITIELTQIDELDTFYERTVELGLERLGFERLAMFLYDEKDGTALGTYGTDRQGKLVDERNLRFTPDPNGIMLRAFGRAERFYFEENVSLFQGEEPIGFGWNAATVLWNGTQSLGWLVADNLLAHTPASKPLLDILGLYGLTVGTLLAQKQAQIALRESEALYRLLAENISDMVTRLNAVGEYVYVSPSAHTVLGYESAELIGQAAVNYVHPDDLALVAQGFATALAQSSPGVGPAVRFRHKQGHYLWLESFGQTIRSEKTGAIEGFISSSRDVSDRKQAEEALRESEERFRQIAENIDQILFIRSGDDQQMLYISPRYEIMWGKSRESLYANPSSFVDPIHPDDLDYVFQQLNAKRYVEESYGDFEYRIIPSGQQIRWVRARIFPIKDDNGVIIRRAGTIEDITERKHAEKALRDSEDKFRLLLDAAPVATIISDQMGRITLINVQAETLFGYSRTELLGQSVDVLVPDYARKGHADKRATYIAEPRVRQMGSGLELFAQRSNGSEFPVEIELSYVQTAAELLVISFVIDISEHKKAEAALWQNLEKERELSELKSRFVSMASHEFRTPLATILALTETLSAYRQKMADEQIEERLGKIRDQVDHLKNIMDDVLQLARLQARRADFNPVRSNLDSLCRSILDEFQSHPDITHELQYSCDAELQEVTLDKKLMRQIISNLVSNAIKYSPNEKPITISLESTGKAVALKVRDGGIGIPEADLKHLFEPFHRASNVGAIAGTGLGLVITKESVELHGGTIAVESQIGVGTTFIVNIPIVADGD
jgi:PAS domain S-box-containing protein